MASKREKVDWHSIKVQRKKQKMEQVEKYLETKKLLESATENNVAESKQSSIAVAIAGSIIDNAQTEELAMCLAGQIGRACAIYKIDEIIVFDDKSSTSESRDLASDDLPTTWHNCVWLAKVLQYLECPQYLRKDLFPISNDFRCAGVLNPLDTPHHLRRDSISMFREGVVLDEFAEGPNQVSVANVGLPEKIRLDRELKPGTRVTVQLSPKRSRRGYAVSLREPKKKLGLYWGYEVRLARNLSSVFTESPHKRGYNLTVGTSDKGECLNDVYFKHKRRRRTLIVIGGLQGLEFALANDKVLKDEDIVNVFDHYVNVCPDQGSRTIRSEEALLISLALITDKLKYSV